MKKFLPILFFALASVSCLQAADRNVKEYPGGSYSTVDRKWHELPDGSFAPTFLGVTEANSVASFSASTAAFTPGATPNDVFTITGSASKTVRVYKACLSGVQTTAGVNSWFLAKRSSANSGGTSFDVVEIPNDSSSAAATATVLQYTANPTVGTLVGYVWSGKINSPAPATAGIGGYAGTCIDFTEMYGQPIVLRGTGEVLAWYFSGVALPAGLSIHPSFSWTEE